MFLWKEGCTIIGLFTMKSMGKRTYLHQIIKKSGKKFADSKKMCTFAAVKIKRHIEYEYNEQ